VESADDRSCSVLNDDFSGGINTDVWTREVRLDGYGHGEFEWTTNSDNNSFVKDGTLYLVPTLTSDIIGEDAITNGYTLNLTADGTCTSTNVSQCVAVSNSSRLTVINPVRSARLTTRNSVNIKYGKVEVALAKHLHAASQRDVWPLAPERGD
jgi:beta-glucanase (GH16 family)